MLTTMSTKGQIVLPAELRAADGLQAGAQFEVERVAPDTYQLTLVAPPPNAGLMEWLRACPDESGDWFTPVASESTDDL